MTRDEVVVGPKFLYILWSDITEIDIDVTVVTINKCIEKMKGYSKKLENQTKELCNV